MSRQVHDMFSEIAESYDRANSLLSFGVHHRWRKKTVHESKAKPGDSVVDCATGTGDLAIEFKKKVLNGRVVGTDFCSDMLAHAPAKAKKLNLEIEWEVQDAMYLTYPDATFDIAAIAFGIRNVDEPVVALQSMSRVVKSGGRVMILEFGTPRPWMKLFFSAYSKGVIPFVGGFISGNRDAYAYLTRTSAAFPTGEEFIALMKKAGTFRHMRFLTLSGGIAYLYIGIVE